VLDVRNDNGNIIPRTLNVTALALLVWLALDAPDYGAAERLNLTGGLDKD
jgi:hypothetical protein